MSPTTNLRLLVARARRESALAGHAVRFARSGVMRITIARRQSWLPRTAIVSYPKSGNTYVRRLLFHAWPSQDGAAFRHVEEFCPTIELLRSAPDVFGPAPMFKSHDPVSWLHRSVPDLRVVYVFRDQTQVYPSYARQLYREGSLPTVEMGTPTTIHRLCSYGSWEDHLADALSVWIRRPEFVYMVPYDHLVREPRAVLESTLRFLGADPGSVDIERAVGRSRPDRFEHDVSGELAVGLSGRANHDFIHSPQPAGRDDEPTALYARVASIVEPPRR